MGESGMTGALSGNNSFAAFGKDASPRPGFSGENCSFADLNLNLNVENSSNSRNVTAAPVSRSLSMEPGQNSQNSRRRDREPEEAEQVQNAKEILKDNDEEEENEERPIIRDENVSTENVNVQLHTDANRDAKRSRGKWNKELPKEAHSSVSVADESAE